MSLPSCLQISETDFYNSTTVTSEFEQLDAKDSKKKRAGKAQYRALPTDESFFHGSNLGNAGTRQDPSGISDAG